MTPLRSSLPLSISALAIGLCWSACSKPAAPPEQRLLVLDGIEIRLDDVAPFVTFLDSFLPEAGPKTKVQRVLDEYLIPLRLAQRAFPKERQQLRAQADALCSVATNVLELENQSRLVKERRRSSLKRTQMHLPLAMFAFDPLHVSAVSQPIEMPEGWFVVGVYDLRESPALVLEDYVDALQVAFATHGTTDWLEYYRTEKARLADKATFVHPDYTTAMPDWIRIKKTP